MLQYSGGYCDIFKYGPSRVDNKIPTLEACFRFCRDFPIFHYHVKGVSGAWCSPEGCRCVCHTRADTDGGCSVKIQFAATNIYKVLQ